MEAILERRHHAEIAAFARVERVATTAVAR
jgi:hypothetical protein